MRGVSLILLTAALLAGCPQVEEAADDDGVPIPRAVKEKRAARARAAAPAEALPEAGRRPDIAPASPLLKSDLAGGPEAAASPGAADGPRGAVGDGPGTPPDEWRSWPLYRPRDPADPADARKLPFTIEALYRLRSVDDPRWSPDGTRLLLVATSFKLRSGKSNADIYLVEADGRGLRRMTRHEGSDSHPRWAPDGKSFLFVSDRAGGEPQVFRMPADGGEAEQLTRLATGASDAEWSPDGKHIAFSSRVFPEHGADDAANRAALEDIKGSPVQAHLADELLYRHWTSYTDGRRDHLLVLNLKSGKVTDVTPGDFDSPVFSLSGGGFSFSPDGKEICFASNRQPGSAPAWTTNADLFVAALSGEGTARNLTEENQAYDGSPAYSPDGRYIAFLRQKTPGYESDRPRLALYDRKLLKVRELAATFDNWALDLRWTSDSRALVFRAAERGRFPLYRVDIRSGEVRRLGVPLARGFDVARDGRLAFIYTQMDMPVELYAADAEGARPVALTHFNDAVAAAHDLRPARELWIPGAGGRMVHTFVVTPHGFSPDKRYPLIINVHGGPQYQWSDMLRGDWQVYPGAGYVVAFFNPHGSIGYGQAYTAAISRDWGGRVFEDVMKVTEALAALPFVDDKHVGAMGWSYGGYMMNWILGQAPGRFQAVASMMGVYDLRSKYGATEELWFPEWDIGGTPWDNPEAYTKWSPSTYAGRFKTPTLVITGERDYRVPYTQSLQLFTALRRRGVPARLIVFPNDGHWPSWARSMPLYYAAHLDWFHRYLGGGPSPYDIREMVRGRAFSKKKNGAND